MTAPNIKASLRTAGRVLLGQSDSGELAALDRRQLPLGLLATWLVGIGRHWDNPRLQWFQHLGLGSLAYVFVLAALLWVVVAPFRPPRWTYENVLTFVTLTSPPAVFYAIPVERFLPLETATLVNVWFLAMVALWRVTLLLRFLTRRAKLATGEGAVVALLPLTLIVTALTMLNLDEVVFDVMSGNSATHDPNVGAYTVLVVLTTLATFAFLPLLIAYVLFVVRARRVWQQKREEPY